MKIEEEKNKKPVLVRLTRPITRKAIRILHGWPQNEVNNMYLEDLEEYVKDLESRTFELRYEIAQLNEKYDNTLLFLTLNVIVVILLLV